MGTVSDSPLWMSAHPNKRQSHTSHHLPAQREGLFDARAAIRVPQRHPERAGGLGAAQHGRVGPGWTRRGGNPPPWREVKEVGRGAHLHACSCRLACCAGLNKRPGIRVRVVSENGYRSSATRTEWQRPGASSEVGGLLSQSGHMCAPTSDMAFQA